ncbi:MAG: type II toxin-antitoxin system RelE/ParE family toxin [Methanomassiliicoccaceae archaeon]|nr:type II toxin-antitoxin system RelE/ParE family toxin [Methanomassiliicoccaceae archaeon]
MKYKVSYEELALKQLRKMEKRISERIITWIDKNLDGCENPRKKGKALTGSLAGIWRYRVGNHRVLAEIKDGELVILVIDVGDRKNVYE